MVSASHEPIDPSGGVLGCFGWISKKAGPSGMPFSGNQVDPGDQASLARLPAMQAFFLKQFFQSGRGIVGSHAKTRRSQVLLFLEDKTSGLMREETFLFESQ